MAFVGKKRAIRINIKIISCQQVEQGVLRYALEVDPDKVNIFQATFEAFDGLATVRTFDAERGGVELFTNPQLKDVVEKAIEKMSSSS